jgi:hypothetical protein
MGSSTSVARTTQPTEDRAEREWSSFGLHGLSLHGYRMIFHDMALEPQEVSDLLASWR